MVYQLIFDEIILKQLQKAAKNKQIQEILTKMFDKIERDGPDAGKLIDSKLFLYEIKCMHPPIRLYFKHNIETDEICIFEFEMKTSQDQQQETINKLRYKIQIS